MFQIPTQAVEPRASRIVVPDVPLTTEIWMGGADALYGEPVLPEDLRDAWVIDLAGDMPAAYRPAARVWVARVFADVESVPHSYLRLTALAQDVAACLRGANDTLSPGWSHPTEAPPRLYVMCQQGMNRSGLVTGLILRALGVPAERAVEAIVTRPGALTNHTFARLVRAWPEG